MQLTTCVISTVPTPCRVDSLNIEQASIGDCWAVGVHVLSTCILHITIPEMHHNNVS